MLNIVELIQRGILLKISKVIKGVLLNIIRIKLDLTKVYR